LFGGTDGVAGIYSISQAKVIDTLKCGSPVTATAWWGSRAIVATSAGTVKVFEGAEEIAEMSSHAGAVTSLSLHPGGSILASAGVDKRFAFHDLETFKTVSQVYTEEGITCCSFHVDGLLFFTGSVKGNIHIFDVKTGVPMTVLEEGGNPVRAISFSENGTWFAVAQKGSNSVSVWDLRKQGAPIKVLDVGSPVDSLCWDYTGQFLATAGSGSVSIHQYTKSSKSWSVPVQKAVPARDVAWGASANSLVALTPDGGLSFLGES
jgi:pre-mRNA-processing factor 19